MDTEFNVDARVSSLSENAKETILKSIVWFMYRDFSRWNREKECNGGDLVELVGSLCEYHNLVPDQGEND